MKQEIKKEKKRKTVFQASLPGGDHCTGPPNVTEKYNSLILNNNKMF